MNIQEMLGNAFNKEQSAEMHSCRLNAALDVAEGTRLSQNLSIAHVMIWRKLSGEVKTRRRYALKGARSMRQGKGAKIKVIQHCFVD